MLLRARDDLGVEAPELLREREVVVVEGVGARGVVQVQHAQHAAVVHERHAQRALHIAALAQHAELFAVGAAAHLDRARFRRGAAGDAFAELHANLRP